jgi:hypothetical protein
MNQHQLLSEQQLWEVIDQLQNGFHLSLPSMQRLIQAHRVVAQDDTRWFTSSIVITAIIIIIFFFFFIFVIIIVVIITNSSDSDWWFAW